MKKGQNVIHNKNIKTIISIFSCGDGITQYVINVEMEEICVTHTRTHTQSVVNYDGTIKSRENPKGKKENVVF